MAGGRHGRRMRRGENRSGGWGVGLGKPKSPAATSASSCPAGRTRRSHPRSFRGAGTAWSTRQFERYISVSKVLSAADEYGPDHRSDANRRTLRLGGRDRDRTRGETYARRSPPSPFLG